MASMGADGSWITELPYTVGSWGRKFLLRKLSHNFKLHGMSILHEVQRAIFPYCLWLPHRSKVKVMGHLNSKNCWKLLISRSLSSGADPGFGKGVRHRVFGTKGLYWGPVTKPQKEVWGSLSPRSWWSSVNYTTVTYSERKQNNILPT